MVLSLAGHLLIDVPLHLQYLQHLQHLLLIVLEVLELLVAPTVSMQSMTAV